MMLKSERHKIEAKKREWNGILREFDEFRSKVWQELRKDFRTMINWLLFYKPKGKIDKAWHIFEVIIAWIIIQLAWSGLRGW